MSYSLKYAVVVTLNRLLNHDLLPVAKQQHHVCPWNHLYGLQRSIYDVQQKGIGTTLTNQNVTVTWYTLSTTVDHVVRCSVHNVAKTGQDCLLESELEHNTAGLHYLCM